MSARRRFACRRLDRAQPHAITTANGSTAHDRRVHTNVGPIVLDCRSQDTTVHRQISLGQRCHDTATASSSEVQPTLLADNQAMIDPGDYHTGLSTLQS